MSFFKKIGKSVKRGINNVTTFAKKNVHSAVKDVAEVTSTAIGGIVKGFVEPKAKIAMQQQAFQAQLQAHQDELLFNNVSKSSPAQPPSIMLASQSNPLNPNNMMSKYKQYIPYALGAVAVGITLLITLKK